MDNKHKKQEVREDLKTKLLRQLEETGYPVELKVGNILLEHGWTQVEHNRYYIDEDEKKGREIDIYAYTASHSKKYKVGVGLSLICEVKQPLKNPWVVLSNERSGVEAEGYERLHCAWGHEDRHLLSFDEIERRSTTRQFSRIGRSYYEGFKSANAKSVIFEALTAVVKASEYWLKREE